MDKPDDVPQWAWDELEGTVEAIQEHRIDGKAEIARAIMRIKNDALEAAARVADPIDTDQRMSDYEKQAYDLRDVISQAIRNLKHEG